MPSFYPENNVALAFDSPQRSLVKIVDLLQGGGGGGGGGGSVFTTDHGSPEGVTVGSPGDRYWDLDTDFEYTKLTGVATNTGWAVH